MPLIGDAERRDTERTFPGLLETSPPRRMLRLDEQLTTMVDRLSSSGATMIHVIARITAHPGKRAELLRAFRKVVPLVHQEHGCIEYEPVVDVPGVGAFQTELGEDTYLVVEKWESQQDLAAHSAAPHMLAFGAAAKDLVADRVIHVLAAST